MRSERKRKPSAYLRLLSSRSDSALSDGRAHATETVLSGDIDVVTTVCVRAHAMVRRVDEAMAKLDSKLQTFENETANPLSEESEKRSGSKSSSNDAATAFETED